MINASSIRLAVGSHPDDLHPAIPPLAGIIAVLLFAGLGSLAVIHGHPGLNRNPGARADTRSPALVSQFGTPGTGGVPSTRRGATTRTGSGVNGKPSSGDIGTPGVDSGSGGGITSVPGASDVPSFGSTSGLPGPAFTDQSSDSSPTTLPPVTIPSIPGVTVPTIPGVTIPDVTVPSLPSVTVPPVTTVTTLPAITPPVTSAPAATTTTTTTLPVTVPTVTVPTVPPLP